MACNKFRVGDRVVYKKGTGLAGEIRVVKAVDYSNVSFTSGGWDSACRLKLVEPAPVYEDEWILNDGKVTIPEGAKLSHCDDWGDCPDLSEKLKGKEKCLSP